MALDLSQTVSEGLAYSAAENTEEDLHLTPRRN